MFHMKFYGILIYEGLDFIKFQASIPYSLIRCYSMKREIDMPSAIHIT